MGAKLAGRFLPRLAGRRRSAAGKQFATDDIPSVHHGNGRGPSNDH